MAFRQMNENLIKSFGTEELFSLTLQCTTETVRGAPCERWGGNLWWDVQVPSVVRCVWEHAVSNGWAAAVTLLPSVPVLDTPPAWIQAAGAAHGRRTLCAGERLKPRWELTLRSFKSSCCRGRCTKERFLFVCLSLRGLVCVVFFFCPRRCSHRMLMKLESRVRP